MATLNDCSSGDITRVFCDGCFDVFHYGHANVLRQAKEMGHVLVAGVHSDAEINKHKGPTVFTEQERYKLVRALKWVDEVMEGVPYLTLLKTIEEANCDFCVHGDDISISADGIDSFAEVKAAKKFRECQRTVGVSTTDIINRILLMESENNNTCPHNKAKEGEITIDPCRFLRSDATFTSMSLMASFFGSKHPPKTNSTVVYCCGAFDLFHVGHVAFLEKAAKYGDYVIAGVHSDLVYISDVVIGAPYYITEDMLDAYKIDIVCHGVNKEIKEDIIDERDPFEVPKRHGKFILIDSGTDMHTDKIIQRVVRNRLIYEERNKNKVP